MRTLKIESNGNIFIDGSLVDLSNIDNKTEFFYSLLTLDVEFSEDITLHDLIHFFYESREVIKNILSEEYEVIRALVTTTNLPRDYKLLKIYKSFRVEKEDKDCEFMYLLPEIELIPSNQDDDGVKTLSSIPIVIDENIQLKYNDTTIESKTKINLLDVMVCLFEELAIVLKEGKLLF